jgi:FtsH-binding integral membrane protein
MSYSPGTGRDYDRQVGERYSEHYDAAAGVPVAAASTEVRAAFLQRVYMTLLAGIGIMLASSLFMVTHAVETLRAEQMDFLTQVATGQRWFWVFLAYLGLAFATSGLSRRPGINVLLYGAFTVMTGALVAPLCLMAYVKAGGNYAIIWNAFGLTALVFGGLTGYVLITKKDFSFLGGMLWVGLLVLLGFIVGSMFFPAMTVGVTVGGIALFALFVLYDTSVIMHQLTADQWMSGALSLFIDFINLFIRILSLLSNRD